MKRTATALCVAALLAGCMTVGTKVDPAVVSSFQPGVTTLSEAEARLGQPNSTTQTADGQTIIAYSYTKATPSGSSYVPVVGAFTGHTDAQSVVAVLTFDRTGKFVRSSNTQSQTSAGMFGTK